MLKTGVFGRGGAAKRSKKIEPFLGAVTPLSYSPSLMKIPSFLSYVGSYRLS